MSSRLHKSSYLLEALLNHVPDAIYFKDLQSHFIMVNRACAEKHGWKTLDAVKNLSDFDVFSRAHAEQAFADEQKIIATGESLRGIVEKETWPDGRITWVSTSKMPLKDERGRIIGTFGISRDITQRKEAELRLQQAAEEMRIITEEMENDLRMAGELQKTFFPSGYPVFPAGASAGESCIEFLHEFRACSDVAGDYCAVHRVSETEAGIFLCDVQGIGVRSALGTALIRGLVQEMNSLGLEPGAFLSRMNELLYPLVRGEEELLLRVTACYLLIDMAAGTLRFSSAGHPLPMLFREASGAEWLCAGGVCCGPGLAEQPDTLYRSVEKPVAPGDSVVMFTDGLSNVRNTLDESYGFKRVLDSAHSLVGEPLAEIFDGLVGDARAFAANGRLTDDVCLVGFNLRRLLR